MMCIRSKARLVAMSFLHAAQSGVSLQRRDCLGADMVPATNGHQSLFVLPNEESRAWRGAKRRECDLAIQNFATLHRIETVDAKINADRIRPPCSPEPGRMLKVKA
jgi:hypothetical protein